MIDHVSVGVADLEKSAAFYSAVLDTIGMAKLIEKPGTVGFGKSYPEFWINQRPDLSPAKDGGSHVCLRCREKSMVHEFHDVALKHGGTDAGEPGLRSDYKPDYYAAFICDLDGNKLEVVTFLDGSR